jgi:hypothetical protein
VRVSPEITVTCGKENSYKGVWRTVLYVGHVADKKRQCRMWKRSIMGRAEDSAGLLGEADLDTLERPFTKRCATKLIALGSTASRKKWYKEVEDHYGQVGRVPVRNV